MRCYQVNVKGREGEHAEVVYAHNAREARKTALPLFDCSFGDLEAKHVPHGDQFSRFDTPKVENNPRNLRELFLQFEGEQRCTICGKAPMGLQEFDLCPGCLCCPSCKCRCPGEND